LCRRRVGLADDTASFAPQNNDRSELAAAIVMLANTPAPNPADTVYLVGKSFQGKEFRRAQLGVSDLLGLGEGPKPLVFIGGNAKTPADACR
jgi:hypothetical protein